jgi:hypothetical protein
MRKLVLGLLGASALAISSAASAVVIVPGPNAPDGTGGTVIFATTPNPVLPTTTGVITATIGHTGIVGTVDASNPNGTPFQDIFQFILPETGVGSGAITTSVALADFLTSTDLDINSVVITNSNGTFNAGEIVATANNDPSNTFPGFPQPCSPENSGTSCGANETFSANNIPITAGDTNFITVTGTSRGLGAYGGSLTFTPTNQLPEPATWAMMLLGFGGLGWQLRRKRSGAALTQFA